MHANTYGEILKKINENNEHFLRRKKSYGYDDFYEPDNYTRYSIFDIDTTATVDSVEVY